jgi:hypothetical protein
MRRLIVTLGLVAGVLLSTAASAMAFGEFQTSRLPAECSEESICTTKGHSIESEGTHEFLGGELNQRFKFGELEIRCAAGAKAKTIGEGAITWSSNENFASEVKFAKCKYRFKDGQFFGISAKFNYNPETKKSEPIKIVYHNNGTAEFGTGETEGEAEIAGGSAGFVIGAKICKIAWPSQKIPLKVKEETEYSFAKYSNKEVAVSEKQLKKFPTGFQTRMVIFSHFTKMLWSYEEGQCVGEGGFEEEAAKTEGKNGVYEGAIEYQVNGGNLFFE